MLTRFAPSPTGFLHIGNMRTALICYLYAKKEGGEFLLRIDDTDGERSKLKYVDATKRDLEWLGISWDKTFQQSEHFDLYNSAIEKLKTDGRLYPCFETREELGVKRKMQLGRGLPPIYDRSALNLTKNQIAEYESNGITPHWRFRLNDELSEWDDEIRGITRFEGKHSSDPILIRENGVYTYMLPSTVDDIESGVTHVLRGEDHVSNTAIQIQIFNALGGEIPKFAHNSLIKTKDGKLSKRAGSTGVIELKEEEGIESLALASFLAKVGTSDDIELCDSMEQIINEFSIRKFGRSPTMYSINDIKRLNTKLLHSLSFDDFDNKKSDRVYSNANKNDLKIFWKVVQPNITTIKEAEEWWKILDHNNSDFMTRERVDEIDEDTWNYLKEAFGILSDLINEENLPWNADTYKVWIESVKEKTGRKGKELFMPIRVALTDKEKGPELAKLMPLFGSMEIGARLFGLYCDNPE